MANFPTDLIIKASSIESVDSSVDRQYSVSGKSQIITRDQQRWQFDITFNRDANQQSFNKAFAEICALNFGMLNTTITHPLFRKSQGNVTPAQSVTLLSTVNSGSVVTVQGLVANQNDSFRSGDFIRFSGHTKVYVITSTNNNSNASGQMTFNIYPTLRESVLQNESVIFESVEFTMFLDPKQDIQMKLSAPKTSIQQKISLIEQL